MAHKKPKNAKEAVKKDGDQQGGVEPVLLSGGNPQIAKADGDAPVQAYIAAMPGWKSEIGRQLDTLIVRTVPDVRKAVRWNSPFYGVEGQGWFLSYHVFTRFVKVTFFQGGSLEPLPPGSGKVKDRAGSTSSRTGSKRSKWRNGLDKLQPCPAGLDFDNLSGLIRQPFLEGEKEFFDLFIGKELHKRESHNIGFGIPA